MHVSSCVGIKGHYRWYCGHLSLGKMKNLAVPISLLLLLNISAPVPASSLQGSCIEAGFTECCNPQDGDCYAEPTFCLCEPSCRMHDDCCEDIDEICPLAANDLKPASPELLLSVNITFHTATVMWTIPAEASENDTYTVLYWTRSNPNITLVHNSSVEATIGHMRLAIISGLEPGTPYQWIIETDNLVSSSRSLPSNFTTVRPVKLEYFKVGLHNSSAVVVSWASPPLPSGVQLREYVVHYKQTTSDTVSSTEFITTTMADNYGIIEGLSSGANYEFWVEAVIQEIDGTLQTGDVLSAGNVTLFIPDAVIVQLRGGPFKPCRGWTQETEVEVLEIFRHVIRQTCTDRDSDLQDTLIHRDFVLCEHSSISSKESRAIYRATLYSTPNYTVQIISSLLEEYIRDGEFSDNPLLSGFQVDKTCPTTLHVSSEPLCSNECPDSVIKVQTGSLGSTSNCSCEMESEDMVVTLPLLVAALVAELFLMLFVLMFVATLVIGIRRRRLDDDKVTSQDPPHPPHADPNIYT